MKFDRRRLFAALAGAASAGAAVPASAREMPGARAEIDAGSFGVHANAEADQTTALQRAIDGAAAAGSRLRLGPGVYRAGGLTLPAHAAVAGIPGSTRLVMTGGPSLMASAGSDYVSLGDLILDGNQLPLPDDRALLHLTHGRSVRVTDCIIANAGASAITVEAVAGAVTGNTVIDCAQYAIFARDAAGLRIAGNAVRGAGNGGILVHRSAAGDDGTQVVDNRIEDVANKSGGSGQWGNAVNVYRADNVIVRGNRIINAAYSAVRGNAAANLQIVGNTCSGLGECALFVELASQGAVVADNIVDGAAVGIAIANFDQQGRLAVVQGNLIRNLKRGRPAGDGADDAQATGISVEADAAVSGNVVENVEGWGIQAGWGEYLRDVAISANVVRDTDIGVAVSVAQGAGAAVITGNLIAGARMGAILGMEWRNPVSGDLSRDGAGSYPQLSISGNHVR